MFLNRLSEEEKKAFLELAHHVARVDDNFHDQEQIIIDKYCMEMQMDDIEYDESSFDIENTLSIIKEESNKKIVLLEVMALVYSDNILHPAEEKVLNKIVTLFKLNPNLAIVYKEWAKSILSLFTQGEALIHI